MQTEDFLNYTCYTNIHHNWTKEVLMSSLTVEAQDQMLGIICQPCWDKHIWNKTHLSPYHHKILWFYGHKFYTHPVLFLAWYVILM